MPSPWREELRVVVRALWRGRAFTVPAVLTLASGAAAAILVFALVWSALLRPLPVADQHRLIVAWRDLPASGYLHHPFGDRTIERAAAAHRLFSVVAGVDANGSARNLLIDGEVSYAVSGALVTGRFFEVLGTSPLLGRALGPADDVEGAEPALVIAETLWRSRFGGSPGVLGRRVTFSGRRFTIVGVIPAGLDYPAGVEAWRTTHTVPTNGPFGDAARREIDLVARLQSGVTLGEATAGIHTLLTHAEDEGPRGSVASVRRFEDAVVGAARRPLLALLAAVALVLVIACANVANLQLMRVEARRGELALHVALGAGPWRIQRQVALEVLVICAVAVAVATPLAWWGLRVLVAVLPAGVPRLDAVRMDAVVGVVIVALPLLMTVVASLPAALSLRRGSIVGALGHAGRVAPPSATGRRLLVVAQVALALAIVAASAVLVRALVHLRFLDTGLPGDRLLFAELSLSGAAAERARHGAVLEAVTSRIASLPGVVAATPVNAWPYAEAGWDVPAFTAEGQDATAARANPSLNLEAIGPRHFLTLGVPIVQGRAFSGDDRAGSGHVAIVSVDVAARTWPGVNPIGRRLKMGIDEGGEPWRTIVGVAAPIRYRELATAKPTIYLPAAQFLDTAERVAVRTVVAPGSIAPLIRGHVEALDPGVKVLRVAPFASIVAERLAQPRFHATLSSTFATAAALLAAIGLYAVLAASVRQRTREIAIRVAVGATPWTLRRMVAAEAAWLVGVGAAIGIPCAIGLLRLLADPRQIGPLHQVGALGTAIALLAAASGVAAYWPVRRALRVDPAVSLRA
jgi:predicted permease